MLLAILGGAPLAFAGQGTASYLDFDGTNPGFGTPTDISESSLAWSTSAAGTAATTARPSSTQLTIGAVATDFAGSSPFNINLDGGGNLQGVIINSANVNVTFTGTANTHNNSGPNTWAITNGATLTVNDTRQAFDTAATVKGLNWNNVAVTFKGGGTINFQTPMGANSTASNVMSMLPTGVINLQMSPISTAANYTGGFNLNSGILNFASAGSTNAFSGFAAGKPFLISGGVIDNTTFTPLTLNIGAGGISLSGNLTFTGSSSLDLGTAAVTNTANHNINVAANTLSIGGVISAPANVGITKIGNGTLQLYGASTYSGNTIVLQGTLALTNNGSIANSPLIVSNSTFDVSSLKKTATVSSLSISNSTLVVQALPSTINLTTPVLNVGGATNLINFTFIPPVTAYPATFHIFQATTVNGTLNFGLGTLPASGAYVGYVTNHVASGSVDFVLTSGPPPVKLLTWRGINDSTGLPDGTWDTGGTITWLAGATPSVFSSSDLVTFDDSAAGQTTIALSGILQPSSLTVNNSAKNYVFTGGSIADSSAGSLALNKTGTGTLLLQESGDNFSGGINVGGGTVIIDNDSSAVTGGTTVASGATLQIGTNDTFGLLPAGTLVNNGTLVFNRADNFTIASGISGNGAVQQFNTNTVTLSGAGSGNWTAIVTNGTIQVANSASLGSLPGGAVTITNGGTLDLGADSTANDINFGAKQFLVSGAGALGNGAIINSGNVNQQNAFQNIVLTSDTTFGGPSRFDLRGGAALLDLAGYTLTKTNANQISLVSPKITSGNIVIQQGVLSIEANPNFTNTTGTITVNSGGYLGQFKDIQGFFTRSIVLNGGGTTNLSGGGSVCFVDAPILLTADSSIGSPSGTEYFDNVISDGGSGFGITQAGLGTNYLQGTNTYLGATIIAQGTFGLTNRGSIASSSAVVVTNAATFDISKSVLPFGGAMAVSVGDEVNGAGTFVLGTTVVTNLSSFAVSNATITLSVTNPATLAITVNNLILGDASGSLNLNISALPPTIGKIQFPLIKYTTITGSGSIFPTLPAGWGANIVNNTANNSIDLQITTVAPGVWDGGNVGVDSNWSDALNWSGSALVGQDSLTFTGTLGLHNNNDQATETATSITFAPGAGAFVLGGNPVTLAGNVVNSSSSPQLINLGLDFGVNVTLDGGTAGLIIGNGLTNTFGSPGSTTLTLAGLGTLTNLLNSSTVPGGTNSIVTVDGANWTLMNNSSSTPIAVPWALNFQAGTFNFGTASSAPILTNTTIQGLPADNQLGTVSGSAATLNIVNGILTTGARLNTATANTSTGIVNQVGGTLTVASQIQGANNATTGAQSLFNISGGTLNVGTDDGGTFYVASRDGGALTVTNTGLVICGNLDISRNANGNARGSVGVVNLNGGTLSVGRVGTAVANSQPGPPSSGAAPAATFNFNGGTLKANATLTNNPGAFFQGSTAAPAIPITTIVKAGGAIIDDGGFAITIAEPLQHDATLGATADGGLTKNGSGTNTLSAVNTYTGNTTVNAGTLALSGSGSINNSANITLANAATLDVTARGDGTLTLASGQTLQTVTSGAIRGNLTNSVGSTVSPGGSGTIGTLTASGNVALLGNVAVDISKTGSPANDQVTATGAIAYGGTLNVTLLGGTLTAGDSFQLFNAGSTTGSFTATNLPALDSGLAWNFNAASGNLSVASTTGGTLGFTQPTAITSINLNGANISLNGTNGQSGAAYYLLESTNIALPLSQWKTVATNVLGTSGNYTFTGTNVVTPGAPHQFFILGNTNLNP